MDNGAASDFDGTVWNYIGVGFLELLIIALMGGIAAAVMLTLGAENVISIIVLVVCCIIASAWCVIIFMKWDAKHTILGGYRLKFKASALNFLLNYFKWLLLTVITLGIYSLWLPVVVRRWRARHTTIHPVEGESSYSPQVNYYKY